MDSGRKTEKKEVRTETPAEHIANAVTHGVGFGLSAACLALMVVFTSLHKGVWEIVSCTVYGTMLVVLYLASTLYHSIHLPRVRHVLHIIDHAAIYLLIAGTYTPYLLVPLRGAFGWSLFGVIWGLALLGIVFQAVFINRFKFISTLTYLAMGWMVVAAIIPLLKILPPGGIVWMAAGGLCYTLGVVFYGWKKLKFAHAIWHIFVLAGSLCHFFGILFYISI
ncbi:MAG: hemolysin [Verrucomicrobiota bacterium]|jgi:hemolysin III|nr:hemolysin [Verrucomicrobiota bacterium]MDK2964293.1 hemolysin [Verrucomicrobiota bacterium]